MVSVGMCEEFGDRLMPERKVPINRIMDIKTKKAQAEVDKTMKKAKEKGIKTSGNTKRRLPGWGSTTKK